MTRIRKSRLFPVLIGVICGALLYFLISLLITARIRASDEQTAVGDLPLIEEAYRVLEAINSKDYATLSRITSPQKGLLFAPFSTVEFDRNLVFTSGEVKAFAATREPYIFGADPVTGSPIELTPSEYMDVYIRSLPLTSVSVLGVNTVVKRGNAIENVAEAFPDGVFVDFFFPPTQTGGIDWSSLKVVFEQSGGEYLLVALVRGVYTDQ